MRRSKRRIKRGRSSGDGLQTVFAQDVEATLEAEDREREFLESLSPEDREAVEKVAGLPPSMILDMVKADILDRRSNAYLSREERRKLIRGAAVIATRDRKPGVLVQIERMLKDQEDSDARNLIEMVKQGQRDAEKGTSIATHLHLHLNGLDGDDLAEHLSRSRRAAREIIQLDGAPGTRLVDSESFEDPDQGGGADSLPVQLDSEDPLPPSG